MRALDANVLIRLIVEDDPDQVRLARSLMEKPALVGSSVLMETAWVLRSTYKQPRAAIAAALMALLDVPTVHVADEAAIRWAIGRYRDHGADLADMLHIVAARGASRFASFDRHLAAQAGEGSPLPVESLA